MNKGTMRRKIKSMKQKRKRENGRKTRKQNKN